MQPQPLNHAVAIAAALADPAAQQQVPVVAADQLAVRPVGRVMQAGQTSGRSDFC